METDIERAIISCLLNDSSAYYRSLPVFKEKGALMFENREIAAIYKAIEDVSAQGKEIDSIVVGEHMTKNKTGSYKKISEYSDLFAPSSMVDRYAALIVERYMNRQMRRIGVRVEKAIDEGKEASDIGELIISSVQNILTLQSGSNIRHIKTFVDRALSTYSSAKNTGGISGIRTGLKDLDDLTGGWQKSNLIVIAARPSKGKSNVALSFIVEAAKNTPVLFYSAEMDGLTVIQRMIGAKSEINDRKIKRALLVKHEEDRMISASGEIGLMPIYMDDTARKYIGDIECDARKMVRENGIGLIVVDYIGKLRTNKARSRQEEIADASARLKGIAMENNIPVITLAQLNREVEKRKGIPMLSDLREAGDIEQDADVVMFLYSFDDDGHQVIPEGYDRFSGLSTKDVLCLAIEKQRTGPKGEVICRFTKDTGRITGLLDNRQEDQTQRPKTEDFLSTDQEPF